MSEIDNLRNKIDTITLEMIKLLKTRTDIAKQIGDIKKEIGKSVTDETREDNLRKKTITLCNEISLDEGIGSRFLNFLLNESIKVQSGEKQTHLSIFLKAKSMEQEGKKIIHMEVGEPDFLPPQSVKNALTQVYDKGFIKYGEAKGLPQFREALANKASKIFGVEITKENILVSPGARFAIFSAINTLLKPGEEIIIIEPAWPAYRDCAMFAGIKTRTIRTTLENKWEPTIEQIEEVISPNTKMIVLNYPNNPTGKILPEKLQDQIIEIAKKNDLYVLSDEIYSQYAYSNWKSVLSYRYSKSIVTQSFSKSFSMTGFRIGYAIADTKIIDKMAKLHALCLTNVSEPIQYVAQQVLDADVSENARIIKSRIDSLVNMAKKMNLEFVNPDGAMYLFAKIKGISGIDLSNNLLEHGLAIAPGDGFGDYREFVRISACQDDKTLMEGMDILGSILEK